MSIPRVIDPAISDDLFASAIGVFSIPQVPTDALCVFPGMGEDWRVNDVVRAWNDPDRSARFLMVAPANSTEKTYKPFTPDDWEIKSGEGLLLGVDGEKENAKTQAIWVCTMIRRHNIKSISLFVSPYHLVRAYLTLIKQMLLANIDDVAIIPRPTPVSQSTMIPESRVTAWQSMPGEARRICEYREATDVATLEELRYYLACLWGDPIFADVRMR